MENIDFNGSVTVSVNVKTNNARKEGVIHEYVTLSKHNIVAVGVRTDGVNQNNDTLATAATIKKSFLEIVKDGVSIFDKIPLEYILNAENKIFKLDIGKTNLHKSKIIILESAEDCVIELTFFYLDNC